MSKSTALRGLVFLLLIAAAVAGLVFLPVKDYLGRFLAWVEGFGVWGPVVFAAAYAVGCLFLPGALLTLAAGFAFGVVVGTVVVSGASVTGASLAFWLGRTLARGWVEARVAGNPRFRALDQAVAEQGFKIVLLTRLSPVFPFTLLNYAFGLTRVRFRDYLLASWVGMLPGTVMYVYLGSVVKDLADLASGNVAGGPARMVLFYAGLAATVAVTVYITHLARKALRRAVPGVETPPAANTEGVHHA
jgi:uncharacterized membrane protein YdjX (TVP38/TMEM64 family)